MIVGASATAPEPDRQGEHDERAALTFARHSLRLTMDNARAAWLLSGVRARHLVIALFAWLALLLVCAPAAADDASTRARRVFERAEEDDAALDLAAALTGYEEALRLDPSMSRAMRASSRAAVLRARSEGGFGPLAALERVRRSPALASDPREVDGLVRAAEAFPPGMVRVEVWAFAAEAYGSRLGRPDDAIPLWQRVATDPAADPVVAESAIASLARLHLARGDLASAEAVVATSPRADPKLVRDVRRAVRRRAIHIGAIAVIAAALALAALAVGRAARAGRLGAVLGATRRSTALVLGFAAYVAVAGGLLATGYEDGNARPFLLFGAALLPILLVARAWAAAGAPSRSARGLRAALCATSALGAAFLVLEHVDVIYLEGLGL
jgi:hypothetical protein